VGPATQKEVAPAQANTSRKRDAAEARSSTLSQQQPVALLVATLLLPKAAATGSQLRQPIGPLRLDREGECPGTVAFISCLDSEIDDLGVIL